jgi:putative DNA primase/helicase
MAIASGLANPIPNDGFKVLAADSLDQGINLGASEGQEALSELLHDIDLLILDNLSTLCTTGSESASDAWIPMQNWLLKLRRKGVAVLLVHHAGVNGRQRGTSRREDSLDTVIALKRPEDYSPDQGARFEIHFEKLRSRVEETGALPFEANLAGEHTIRWACSDLTPPLLRQAAQLFESGLTVREVATNLHISKSEAGRLRMQATEKGMNSSGSLASRTNAWFQESSRITTASSVPNAVADTGSELLTQSAYYCRQLFAS